MKRFLLTDMHTHTAFSPDATGEMSEMLAVAHSLGVDYYGLSDHFNFDEIAGGIPVPREFNKPQTPVDEYFTAARKYQKEYDGKMNVLVGAEFGYADNPVAQQMYRDALKKYRPDFVIQSIHTQPVGDYAYGNGYYDEQGKVLDKDEVYENYLGLVRRSAEVDYHYDILGHIGYCARYAPYDDRRMLWKDYSKPIDGILLTLIQRDKILEVNSSNKLGPSLTLPDNDILERYYELGGRKISYGSDSHFPSRILEHREKVVDTLRAIGFEYLTVPCRGEHIKIDI